MKQANCAGCGAQITFVSASSVVAVCEFCLSVNADAGIDVKNVGVVAGRTPLASHFRVGTIGKFDGVGFTVRGQLQLDHGAGLWNEWVAETDDGGWIWIAEAQGELLVLKERDCAIDLEVDKIRARDWIDFGGDIGRYMVAEVGEGKIVTWGGELPFNARVGGRSKYADLARGADEVGTLAIAGGPLELYLGRKVGVSELQLDPQTQPNRLPDRVSASRINCASCGDSIPLIDPEHARRVGCSSCGTLLDVTSDGARILEAQEKISSRPDIPIGAEMTFRGDHYQVLAYLVRVVGTMNDKFRWREYLLRRGDGAYRWLTEVSGHWAFVEPIHPTAARIDWRRSARLGEARFKHFTHGKPAVESVFGECYWDVTVGERVVADDYVGREQMISVEHSDTEMRVSLGHHLDRDELAALFPDAKLPKKSGVGALEPNPIYPLSTWWNLFFICLVGLLLVRIGLGLAAPDRDVLTARFGPTPKAGENKVEVTEPFQLDGASVVVTLDVPALQNGWVGIDGAFVQEETGDVITFGVDCSFWSGVSGGYAWAEGSRIDSCRVGGLKKGEYRLRLDPLAEGEGVNQLYNIGLSEGVPRNWPFVAGVGVLFLGVVFISLRYTGFEQRRWANSDHSWGGST